MDQQLYESLYSTFFFNGSMNKLEEMNSCDYHAMTHDDTEILGAFCDVTGINGNELKKILLLGYMTNMEVDNER
mgnify:CR=1 FL=1